MIIQKKNEQFGITLIALAVTIIVMLILAGVTIATLTGEGGIISRAKEASFRTEMTELEEKVNVLNAQVYLEGRVITDIFTEQVKIEDVKKWDGQIGVQWEQLLISLLVYVENYLDIMLALIIIVLQLERHHIMERLDL